MMVSRRIRDLLDGPQFYNHYSPHDYEPDKRLRGAAEIYERAHAWGHLPMDMEFATFLAALERGDDPFTRRMGGDGDEAAIES
ncbi:MAG: hypothetical protein WBQ86_09565 [Candidatus Binatus sp.]